jgi:hypothetical protein
MGQSPEDGEDRIKQGQRRRKNREPERPVGCLGNVGSTPALVEKSMKQTVIKIGYWSSVLALLFSLGYLASAILMAMRPPPVWTNLAAFVDGASPISLLAFSCIQLNEFLIAPVYVALFCCLHEYAPEDKRILTRLGLCFMVALMVLGDQLVWVHFGVMRRIFSKGITPGMEDFLHWNFDSPLVSSGALGWTFFIGLAFLVVAPIFSGDRLARSLRNSFAAAGGFALFGVVGSFLGSVPLTAIYILGFTLSVIALAIFSAILFKRLGAQAVR